VIAVVGVLIGIDSYQKAQLEKEQREANQAFIDLMQKVEESKKEQSQGIPKVAESKQEQSQEIQKVDESKPAQSQIIQKETPQFFDCAGTAGCLTEYVTRIVDGDTIYTGNLKIRLSLTNTPEINQPGSSQATLFTEKLCPVGSSILVDQDDLQPMDEYGRVLAKVYCGNKVLNSELLYNGYANILTQYCSTSEFSGEPWAQEYGCGHKEIPQPTTQPSQTIENNCDASYPTVCIPPRPPDLDCGDVPYTNFQVLQPDPHGFDSDYDGIGCEKSSQSSVPVQPAPTEENNCDPSYPTVCIPSPPPDLDCGDITYRKFVVLQPDPHRFDGDKDGIGCES